MFWNATLLLVATVLITYFPLHTFWLMFWNCYSLQLSRTEQDWHKNRLTHKKASVNTCSYGRHLLHLSQSTIWWDFKEYIASYKLRVALRHGQWNSVFKSGAIFQFFLANGFLRVALVTCVVDLMLECVCGARWGHAFISRNTMIHIQNLHCFDMQLSRRRGARIPYSWVSIVSWNFDAVNRYPLTKNQIKNVKH
jgi:hypothetical protein